MKVQDLYDIMVTGTGLDDLEGQKQTLEGFEQHVRCVLDLTEESWAEAKHALLKEESDPTFATYVIAIDQMRRGVA